jgi:hypothetical protein
MTLFSAVRQDIFLFSCRQWNNAFSAVRDVASGGIKFVAVHEFLSTQFRMIARQHRLRAIFCNGFNVICLVQPVLKKYASFLLTQITGLSHASRPTRGTLAIVTNVGMGCGGRGSVGRDWFSQGGFPVSEQTACRRTALQRLG